MRLPLLSFLALALIIALPFSVRADPATQPPARTYRAAFDLGKAAPFAGMGTQIWIDRNFPRVRDAILKDLALGWVRMSIPGKISSADIPDGIWATGVAAAFQRRQDPAMIPVMRGAANDLNRLGIKVHLVVWEMPTRWRLDHPRDSHGYLLRGAYADPTHINDYANFVAGQVLYAVTMGFNVTAIEPASEPDTPWLTAWTPADYATLIHDLRRILDQIGFSDVAIEGPGTSTSAAAPAFLDALAKAGDIQDLGHIAVHDWDTRDNSDPFGLAGAFQASLKNLPSPPPPIFVTEFSDAARKWGETPYDGGPGQRGPNIFHDGADSTDYAMAVAAEALKLIADGADGLCYYQSEDVPWAATSFGLIDLEGRLRPAEQALKSWLRLLPPDSHAVAAMPKDAQVIAVAFRGAKSLVIVAANTSEMPVIFAPQIMGVRLLRIMTEHAYIGKGPVIGLIPGFYGNFDHGALSLRLPARAIVAVELGY